MDQDIHTRCFEVSTEYRHVWGFWLGVQRFSVGLSVVYRELGHTHTQLLHVNPLILESRNQVCAICYAICA